MNYFTYQLNKNDCGLTSLKIILANISKDKNYLFLPLSEDCDRQYSLLELKEIAKQFNLFLAGYLIKDVKDIKRENRFYMLVIKLPNNSKHSVVIKKLYKNFAILFDPALGKKIINLNKYFRNIYECEVLIAENDQIVNCPKKFDALLSFNEKIKVYLLEILSILSYLISAYFVDKNSHFIFPVILMLIGVIFAIFYKINTFTILKKIDEKYINITYDENVSKRRENYTLFHKVKSNIILTPTNFIINISSAIGLNLILILQNSYSIFVFLSSSLLLIIDQIIFEPSIKKKNINLEDKESRLFLKEINKENYINGFEEIKVETYRLAKLISLKKIIYLFILLIITVFMSALTNNANINFILFYFAMSIFTFTNFNTALLIMNKNKENIINETRFYYLLNKNNNRIEKEEK